MGVIFQKVCNSADEEKDGSNQKDGIDNNTIRQ
jgi:hypothetical protein